MQRKTKSILITIFLAVFSFTGLSACAQREEKGTVLLWEVTKKGSPAKIHLFGAVQMANEKMYPLDQKIEESFNHSEYLAVECDTSKITPEQNSAFLEKYGAYAGGETLEKRVPVDLYRELGAAFKEYGYDIKIFNPYKPWVADVNLSQFKLGKLGYKTSQGMDVHFLNRARGFKKILEMETPESQLELVGNASEELQLLSIRDTLISNSYTKEYNELLFEYWKRADLKALEELSFEDLKKYPTLAPFFDKAIFQRSEKMAEKIDGYFTEGKNYFVVVSLVRLLGDRSIIRQLEKKGYHIRQL